MAEVIRRKIHEIEPARSVFDMTPLDSHLHEAFGERRLRAVLLSSFALTAVLLACIGVYGTLTYVVTLRRKEVGLRIALGAVRSDIVRRFLFRGLIVSFVGCAAGLCLAAALTRVLAGMLYGVSPGDPQTFAYVLVLVIAVSGLASLWPALRAARVDPMRVLHEQ
jgi:putative ABC transport system permease protein